MNEKKLITLKAQELELFSENRLDKFLHSNFPDYSRSYFQQLIHDGVVLINNRKVTKSGTVLKPNDIVTFYFPPPPSYKATPRKIDFQVIDEQPDFLVINKPAGLLVHAAHTASQEPTLVDGLLHIFSELRDFNDTQRPGIIHRLDKDTSGLMLIARTIPAHFELSKIFKQRTIKKTYLAAVQGHPTKQGEIRLPIGRHPTQRHKMTHYGIASREAATLYHVLKYYDDVSLIAAQILTGRTHQIRVHCAALGHKLLGDATYGVPSPFISRQALHAWKLSFEYKGKHFNYTCPVPEDFSKLLHTLKKL